MRGGSGTATATATASSVIVLSSDEDILHNQTIGTVYIEQDEG